jgi:hypothetical protein
MKLSETTVNILKNFSNINPSILFKPGNNISTVSPTKTMMATVSVDETFEVQAGIYELPKFIGVLSLFDEPDLSFSSTKVYIKSGHRSLSYTCASPEMIIAPSKDIVMPPSAFEFTLPETELTKLNRASSVLQLPDIVIETDDDNIIMAATNLKNPTSDSYKVEVSVNSVADYVKGAVIKAEYLSKLMPRDYVVTITDKNICKFETDKLTYYIALESV